jgi:hypothetical protein
VERDASIERNASSRATIAVEVSADLISALRIASNSLAAVFQVLAHSRFENAVDPGCERLRSSGALAEREEGPFGMIWTPEYAGTVSHCSKAEKVFAEIPSRSFLDFRPFAACRQRALGSEQNDIDIVL